MKQGDIDYNALGSEQLAKLSVAVFGGSVPGIQRVFDTLVAPGRGPSAFPSYVTDDHTPFEFSIVASSAGRGAADGLRLLAEPPDDGKGLLGTIVSGRPLARVLERDHGAYLKSLLLVEDVFLPMRPQGAFALWFAADFRSDGQASFKAYFNPHARGPALAPALVEEMLERLGMRSAWQFISSATQRGPELDDLRFVSLDLVDSADARVKVYTFHRAASLKDIGDVAELAPNTDRKRLDVFLRTVAGGEGFLVAEREVGTCLSFTRGGSAPRACTVHFPIRAYAGDDEIARARIEVAANELGLNVDGYRRVMTSFPSRPLRAGSGLHSYSSLRFDSDGPRLNLYLSPELRAVAPSFAPHRPLPSLPVDHATPTEVVEHYEEQRPFTAHPLFQRIAREPLHLSGLTLLLLNFREAVTRDFARRLASIVARVDDDALRSILAKQLNDELGNGDPSRAHAGLFERLVAGLDAHRPRGPEDVWLAPGRRFGAELESMFAQDDAYEGVGASLIMEVGGRQTDAFLGEQFRRGSPALPSSVLEWLTLHETLEVDHVDESIELARMIPAGPKAERAAHGAQRLAVCGWRFFDRVLEVWPDARP
jgi:DMATS type aromatic prenyltransferase